MTDVSPLYHPIVLRHARQPRLRGRIDAAHTSHDGHNRSCGDRVTLHLSLQEGRVSVRFEGDGCQLSLGSASAICEAVDGQTLSDARAIVASFTTALTGEVPAELAGDLALFLAVRAFPARLLCVSLAPDTLAAALAQSS